MSRSADYELNPEFQDILQCFIQLINTYNVQLLCIQHVPKAIVSMESVNQTTLGVRIVCKYLHYVVWYDSNSDRVK